MSRQVVLDGMLKHLRDAYDLKDYSRERDGKSSFVIPLIKTPFRKFTPKDFAYVCSLIKANKLPESEFHKSKIFEAADYRQIKLHYSSSFFYELDAVLWQENRRDLCVKLYQQEYTGLLSESGLRKKEVLLLCSLAESMQRAAENKPPIYIYHCDLGEWETPEVGNLVKLIEHLKSLQNTEDCFFIACSIRNVHYTTVALKFSDTTTKVLLYDSINDDYSMSIYTELNKYAKYQANEHAQLLNVDAWNWYIYHPLSPNQYTQKSELGCFFFALQAIFVLSGINFFPLLDSIRAMNMPQGENGNVTYLTMENMPKEMLSLFVHGQSNTAISFLLEHYGDALLSKEADQPQTFFQARAEAHQKGMDIILDGRPFLEGLIFPHAGILDFKFRVLKEAMTCLKNPVLAPLILDCLEVAEDPIAWTKMLCSSPSRIKETSAAVVTGAHYAAPVSAVVADFQGALLNAINAYLVKRNESSEEYTGFFGGFFSRSFSKHEKCLAVTALTDYINGTGERPAGRKLAALKTGDLSSAIKNVAKKYRGLSTIDSILGFIEQQQVSQRQLLQFRA